MQDASFEIISGDNRVLAGVCDGHDVEHAAELVAQWMREKTAEQWPQTQKEWRDLMVQLDARLHKEEQEKNMGLGGTTFNCVELLVNDDGSLRVRCINVGDSRSVLASCNGLEESSIEQIQALSEDHKPTTPTELERIEKAGGYVVGGRVNGQLATSRALGDFSLKPPPTEDQIPENLQVTCVPDVTDVEIDVNKFGLCVTACDGLWDVFTSENASERLWHLLLASRTAETRRIAANEPRDWYNKPLERWSSGDVARWRRAHDKVVSMRSADIFSKAFDVLEQKPENAEQAIEMIKQQFPEAKEGQFDRLFDVLRNEYPTVVRQQQEAERADEAVAENPQARAEWAVRRLVEECIALRGSTDNVSITIFVPVSVVSSPDEEAAAQATGEASEGQSSEEAPGAPAEAEKEKLAIVRRARRDGRKGANAAASVADKLAEAEKQSEAERSLPSPVPVEDIVPAAATQATEEAPVAQDAAPKKPKFGVGMPGINLGDVMKKQKEMAAAKALKEAAATQPVEQIKEEEKPAPVETKPEEAAFSAADATPVQDVLQAESKEETAPVEPVSTSADVVPAPVELVQQDTVVEAAKEQEIHLQQIEAISEEPAVVAEAQQEIKQEAETIVTQEVESEKQEEAIVVEQTTSEAPSVESQTEELAKEETVVEVVPVADTVASIEEVKDVATTKVDVPSPDVPLVAEEIAEAVTENLVEVASASTTEAALEAPQEAKPLEAAVAQEPITQEVAQHVVERVPIAVEQPQIVKQVVVKEEKPVAVVPEKSLYSPVPEDAESTSTSFVSFLQSSSADDEIIAKIIAEQQQRRNQEAERKEEQLEQEQSAEAAALRAEAGRIKSEISKIQQDTLLHVQQQTDVQLRKENVLQQAKDSLSESMQLRTEIAIMTKQSDRLAQLKSQLQQQLADAQQEKIKLQSAIEEDQKFFDECKAEVVEERNQEAQQENSKHAEQANKLKAILSAEKQEGASLEAKYQQLFSAFQGTRTIMEQMRERVAKLQSEILQAKRQSRY